MKQFNIITSCILFDQVLQHKHKLKAGSKKNFTITRHAAIVLHKMSRGVLTFKGTVKYLQLLKRDCMPITIHRSLHQLLNAGYCTRSKYGAAYYYKITAKGIALLCMIEEELENIVNSNEL